jgi:hypothetical protein
LVVLEEKLAMENNVAIAKNHTKALKVAIVVMAVATASLVFRSDMNMADRPIQEDGFYSFTVARNLASGNGITVDGVTQTNGFQPFFTFLTVPAFILAGDDKFSAIRYVFILHWLFFLLTAYLLGLIAHDAFEKDVPIKTSSVFWWIVFLYTSSVLVFILNFSGLETGFLLFGYALIWRYYQIVHTEQWRGALSLGALLGLLVLTRIDAICLVIVVSLYELLFREHRNSWVRVGRSIMVSGTAFLVSSPWWFYNLVCFGSFVPTSGRAYQQWMLSYDRIKGMIVALFRTTMPLIYVGQNTLEGSATTLIRVFLILAAIIYIWKAHTSFEKFFTVYDDVNQIRKRTLEFGVLLFISGGLLVVSYALSFSGIWFYTRYFAPMVLVSTLITGLVIVVISQRFPRIAYLFLWMICIPLLAVTYMLHADRLHSDFFKSQLQLVNEHVPPQDHVASFQTGTLGYFREHVVNLDGKVNPKAVEHRGHLLEYLYDNHIEWFCDGQDAFERLIGENTQGQQWKLIGKRGAFALYHRLETP